MTLDRFCGSGLTAVSMAAAQIRSGMEDLVIAGGTEMMSYITSSGQEEMAAGLKSLGIGSGNKRLQQRHPQSHQGLCADAIASMEGNRPGSARCLLAWRVSSVPAVRSRRGASSDRSFPWSTRTARSSLAKDEYPRPQTTAQDLAALKPSFAQVADYSPDGSGVTFRQLINRRYPDLKIEHVHHAGSSSGIVDGAAALLLASKDYARKHGSSRAPASWPPRTSATIRR